MNEEQPEGHQERRRSPKDYKREIAWGIVAPFAALGLTVALASINGYDKLRSLIHSNDACCADFRSYRDEDSGQRQFWVNVIERIRDQTTDVVRRLAAAEAHIEELRRQPGARPDPFTGTEGRELEKRIKRLEQKP